jgi:hypothetical protein
MSKKLSGDKLAEFEARRDIWSEVLNSVREIKSGGGKRHTIPSQTSIACARRKSRLS